MKVFVYAIAKDEAACARRWFESVREADEVLVLDTGSTDGTQDLLQQLGAKGFSGAPDPWRFDAARNMALNLLPDNADICVACDLDEVFTPGWRKALSKAWRSGTTRAQYEFEWTPGGFLTRDWAHSRTGYRWKGPAHESLVCEGAEKTVFARGVTLSHRPEPGKKKASYLPLLELAVREEPLEPRYLHYLGREYMYQRRWQEAVYMLKRHLDAPRSLWRSERSASMRYIGASLKALGRADEAELWLYRAACEDPKQREPLVDLAEIMYEREKWPDVVTFGTAALRIEKPDTGYITEPAAWGAKIYDLLCIAYWKTGERHRSLDMAREALRREPDNVRMRENVRFLEGAV